MYNTYMQAITIHFSLSGGCRTMKALLFKRTPQIGNYFVFYDFMIVPNKKSVYLKEMC